MMNKKNNFCVRDASIGSLLFVILQEAFIFLLTFAISKGFKYGMEGSLILTAFLEFTFALTVVIVCSTCNVNLFKATKLDQKITWKHALFAVILCFVSLYGFNALTNVFYYALRNLDFVGSGASLEVSTIGGLLLEVVCMCAVPAFCEELLFRGLIFNGLKRFGKWPAILLSATFFMLMHGNPDQTVYQWILGVVLAYSFYLTGSLWVPMIIHFTNNFYASVFQFITSKIAKGGNVLTVEKCSWTELASMLYSAVSSAIIAVLIISLIFKQFKKMQNEKTKVQVDATATVDGTPVQAVLDGTPIVAQDDENVEPIELTRETIPAYSYVLMALAGIVLIAEWVLVFIAYSV